ncbi:MAG TPA: endonuclease/exonuclease/phosphatase family protein [Kofleriaceae bacterium]|nr:endonuclease/exonuclease/phosphatase family protein [Kofleriaceae bacterium]
MKVMTLNVLLGGEERFEAICAILAAQRPDLLVLEECLGWEDGARLAAAAAAIGVPADARHTVLGVANQRPSGRRYHVAMVSRAPFQRTRAHAPEEVAHCQLVAEVDDGGAPLLIAGAHFHANDEDSRLVEVDELLRLIPPEQVRAQACILAGDLNSLTRQDPYPPDIDDRLDRAGVHKYGHPPRFEVMDRLLAAGWVDALQTKGSGAWVTARRARAGNGHSVDTRSDYVLVSPLLAPRLIAADVVDVGGASDHHAVIAELAPAVG